MSTDAPKLKNKSSFRRLYERFRRPSPPLDVVPNLPVPDAIPLGEKLPLSLEVPASKSTQLGLPPLPFDGKGSMQPKVTPIPLTSSILDPNAKPSPFLTLPGELRNQIYSYLIPIHQPHPFSPTTLPSTHILLPSANLLATCKQIYTELHQWVYSRSVIHGLYITHSSFHKGVPASRLDLMKTLYIPAPNVGTTSPGVYDRWAKAPIYNDISERLLDKSFAPKTLIFSTECRIGGFDQRVTDSRCARYASALLTLRLFLSLSLLGSVERVYIVDIGVPYELATRDYFADMFERCFPVDMARVLHIQHELRSDQGSWTRYTYPGSSFYTGIPGCELHWDLRDSSSPSPSTPTSSLEEQQRAEEWDEDVDFLLDAKVRDETGAYREKKSIKIYTFSNWKDFGTAFQGPDVGPDRSGKPTTTGRATAYGDEVGLGLWT
jgi:hypothetical protein